MTKNIRESGVFNLGSLRGAELGAELITNGAFTTDLSGWTAGSDWSWNASSAAATDGVSASAATPLTQTITTVAGQAYQVSATVSAVSGGNPSLTINGTSVAQWFSTTPTGGTETVTYTATGTTTTLSFAGGNAVWTVDDVSVRAVRSNYDSSTIKRPTRRWGGITGRSLVTSGGGVPRTGVLSLAEMLQASYTPNIYTRYFALWGAGGAGGSMDRSNGSFGGAGGNGAFLEIKIEGIPDGMQFRMASGGGGSAHLSDTANGGKGGGGGAASLLLCEYEGATALVAVAGGGGGGAGGGQDQRSNRSATAGAGASSTSTTQGDARDHNTTLGGHTASPTNQRNLANVLNPPSKETYAQDGGSGGQGDTTFTANNTASGNAQVGGTLPTGSWGGQGGTSGLENSNEGGGGGGGGGWFGGTGGYGGATGNYGGAGGGGGSSYVDSGTLTIGTASLTITLLQENVGSYRNVGTGTSAQLVVNNPSVTLAYGFTGGTGKGRGGRGGLYNSIIADYGNHGEVRMYTDTTLVQTVTGTSGSNIGQQAVVTIS